MIKVRRLFKMIYRAFIFSLLIVIFYIIQMFRLYEYSDFYEPHVYYVCEYSNDSSLVYITFGGEGGEGYFFMNSRKIIDYKNPIFIRWLNHGKGHTVNNCINMRQTGIVNDTIYFWQVIKLQKEFKDFNDSNKTYKIKFEQNSERVTSLGPLPSIQNYTLINNDLMSEPFIPFEEFLK